MDSQQPGLTSRPIGIFDSGVGGISVLKHIHARLPGENLIYYADSLHAPYGSKSSDEIRRRCLTLAESLLKQNAKALVVACNTATAAAVTLLRQQFPLPVIGMEPAVKPAAKATRSGVVGVLATVGTLQSAQFAALLENFGRDIHVVTRGCPGLVECVEQGRLTTEDTAVLVNQYLQPLLDAGADTIVLGCTHYPFLRPLIQDLAGNSITLIDTGAAVARQLENQLIIHQIKSISPAPGTIRFYTNSPLPAMDRIMESLWQNPITFTRVSEFI